MIFEVEYKKRKLQIKKRLKEFENFKNAKDEDIFSELCFCILTPQTKAVFCDEAIKELKESDLLFEGDKNAISKRLKGLVRFHNNKANYIVEARKLFSAQGGSAPTRGGFAFGESGGRSRNSLDIKSKLAPKDILKTREWLVKNIKGLGYKEASHFLRNIGLGKDIAIIDRHILENLKRYGVITKIPDSINKSVYINIEEKMQKFSHHVKIPLEELDLLLWSNETGFIFK